MGIAIKRSLERLRKRLKRYKTIQELAKTRQTLKKRRRLKRFRTISERSISALAGQFGIRHIHDPDRYTALDGALFWLMDEVTGYGYSRPELQTYICRCQEVSNLIVEVPGTDPKLRDEIVVFGAHYDSSPGSPGANDNGSGVAAVLCLANFFVKRPQQRTMRFLFFVNEEPPMFNTEEMGSYQYAQSCSKRGDQIIAMVTPDTIGYYSHVEGSQHHPVDEVLESGEWPTVGDFLAVVGREEVRELTCQFATDLQEEGGFKSLPIVLPEDYPGVSWSDHASFWKMGYRAILLTDTALYRYDSYHDEDDTPEKIAYDEMSYAIEAIRVAFMRLASPGLAG